MLWLACESSLAGVTFLGDFMSDRQFQSTSKPRGFELVFFLLALLISRFLILLGVHRATHGHEFGDDVVMLMEMLRSPWGLLTNKVHRQQHPPLLPAMEALFGYPLTFFCSNFVTLRVTMILWEVVLGALFYFFLNALSITGRRRTWCLVAFLLLPTGWLTTAVMGEDDAIAACGFLLPLLLFTQGKQIAALFASGFGFIAAKIFIALEVIGLFSVVDKSKRVPAGVAALIPIVLVYGFMTTYNLAHSLPLPLLSFKPNPYFGTNFWIVLHRYYNVNLSKIGTYTGFLALAGSLIPVVLLQRIPNKNLRCASAALACAAMVLIFFSLFYHVEPEYFIMVMPVLLVTAEGFWDGACCALVAFLPWLGKFFQNAAFMANSQVNSGKAVPLNLFRKVFHSSPELWLTGDQLIFSILMFYVSWRWCAKLWRLAKTETTDTTQYAHSEAKWPPGEGV